jgi:hypothetical protein
MSAGRDVFVVSESGTTGYTPLGALRSNAYKKANEFAQARGGMAEVISVNETPAGFAVWPKVDLKFRVNQTGSSRDGLEPVERVVRHTAYDATGRATDSEIVVER